MSFDRIIPSERHLEIKKKIITSWRGEIYKNILSSLEASYYTINVVPFQESTVFTEWVQVQTLVQFD